MRFVRPCHGPARRRPLWRRLARRTARRLVAWDVVKKQHDALTLSLGKLTDENPALYALMVTDRLRMFADDVLEDEDHVRCGTGHDEAGHEPGEAALEFLGRPDQKIVHVRIVLDPTIE